MPGPSLAEVKAAGQPPAVISRLNDEHWAGRLYMRRLSPRVTWVFARLGWSPNAVTTAFIVCGVAAGVVVALPGLGAAVAAAALVQVYLLLDCSDGELARCRGITSAAGVYLDGVGHYLAETALLAGLGIRAQGHLTPVGGFVSAGLAAAVLAALVKAETDNVIVARAKSGLPAAYGDAALPPRRAGLALARRLAGALRAHRAIQAVELSLLILLAAVTDAVRGGLLATRVLLRPRGNRPGLAADRAGVPAGV
jgi:phosphatidylglycerophosphate synthase